LIIRKNTYYFEATLYLYRQVRAADRDVGLNGQLIYRLSPQSDYSQVFSVDANTGQIYIRSALDYERVAEYHLTLMVSDGMEVGNQLQHDAVTTTIGEVDVTATSIVRATALAW